MKQKFKDFFTIDLKKNFIKNKFGYGVAVGVIIACIWCIIGIYTAPYILQAKKITAVNDIAYADLGTSIASNTEYIFEEGTYTNNNTRRNLDMSAYNVSGISTGLYDVPYQSYTDWYVYIGNDKRSIENIKAQVVNNISIKYNILIAPNKYILTFFVSENEKYIEITDKSTGQLITINGIDIILKTGQITVDASANANAKATRTTFNYNIVRAVNLYVEQYNITYAITNGSATPTTLPATGGTIQITPDSGYNYPDTITVSTGLPGPNYTYDNTTGIITVTSISNDLSISAICSPIGFNLTINNEHCYISTAGGGTAPTHIPSTGGNLYINPAYNYTYPQTITVTGTATYTYNNTNGVISFSSVSSDITIDIICELIQVNLNSGYYLFPTIKKLYDMGNLTIPVPNGLKLYQFTNESLTGKNTPASGGADYIGGYKYTTAEPAQEYTLTNNDYFTNNQTNTLFWINNQGKLIRTIQSDNETIEFAGFWVIYIPANSTIEITAQNFYNELIPIPELRLIQEDLYYIIRQFQIDLAETATEKYNEGYAAGYDLGINTNIISDSTGGVISSIFSGIFGTIFNIEIFPNFPLYILILIPLVFSMLGVIFWLIRGR